MNKCLKFSLASFFILSASSLLIKGQSGTLKGSWAYPDYFAACAGKKE